MNVKKLTHVWVELKGDDMERYHRFKNISTIAAPPIVEGRLQFSMEIFIRFIAESNFSDLKPFSSAVYYAVE
jgi:hypothetical protein